MKTSFRGFLALIVLFGLLCPAQLLAGGAEAAEAHAAGCRTAHCLVKDLQQGFDQSGHVALKTQGIGNKKAFKLLSEGKIDFAFTCQPTKKLANKFKYEPSQVETWVEKRVAKDPVVVVVNPGNPVTSLTREQLSDIFLGKVSNWADLGGPDTAILLTYEDDPKDFSGVLGVFKENTVGGKTATIKGAARFADPKERGAYVAANLGGLTFLGLNAYEEQFGKLVRVDGVEPNRENIVNGAYPIAATYYIVYDAERKENAVDFLGYMTSEEGQAAMNRNFISDME